MGRISKYTEIVAPDVDDLLIGTDVENGKETKNFTIQSIADLVSGAAGITKNLQQTTAAGNTTTYDITANKLIKSGGTSSQILAANGDVITAGTNITITAGVISSTGTATPGTDITYTPSPTNGTIISNTGADATIPLTDSTNAGLFSAAEKTALSGLPASVALKENALGNPSINGYVLSSTTTGTRTWIANGSGTGSGVTAVTSISPITSSGGNTPVISTSMDTNKLIGRSSTGNGIMEQIAVGTGLSLDNGTLSTLGVFKGTTQTDLPQLGSEILTSLVTVPTGWTGTSFSTGYTHTSGTDIIQDTNVISLNTMYIVSYIVSNRTLGSVSISVGGLSKSSISSNTTYSFSGITTNTNVLTITPSNTFNGKVIVSLKILSASLPIMQFLKSNNSSNNEFRYSTSGSLFIGRASGLYNLTGINNIFIGNESGNLNVKGQENTFLGTQTGFYNTNSSNTFIGSTSGYSNTEGFENSFLGARSGYSNTTGTNNVFLGDSSGYFNINGGLNVFIGSVSGHLNINGYSNLFLGASSGYGNTSGAQNIFLGAYSGYLNTTGYSNVFIGMSAAGVTDNDNNSIVIGDGAVGLGTGTTVIGNLSTTSTTLGGAVSIQTGAFAIPNASAQLDIVSTTKGFLPPRMTTTQINAIVSPANGLVVFNTTLNTICFYTTSWQKVTSTAM
jgi:hypothetical protein